MLFKSYNYKNVILSPTEWMGFYFLYPITIHRSDIAQLWIRKYLESEQCQV